MWSALQDGWTCIDLVLIKHDDNCNVWHAIKRHRLWKCYVVQTKQGNGKKGCS